MQVEISGKVMKVGDVQEFGKGFSKRELVMEIEPGDHPQAIPIEFVKTATGATPEIVTSEVGWLVPPGQPEALGAVLSQLAQDSSPIPARRAAARARAEAFTVQAMVAGTLNSYLRAVGEI